MIILLQKYLQKSTKLFALVLFVLCSQILLNSHSHADEALGVEICSVCLVGQNTELDDGLFSTTQAVASITLYASSITTVLNQHAFDNSPLSVYLRGPPA